MSLESKKTVSLEQGRLLLPTITSLILPLFINIDREQQLETPNTSFQSLLQPHTECLREIFKLQSFFTGKATNDQTSESFLNFSLEDLSAWELQEIRQLQQELPHLRQLIEACQLQITSFRESKLAGVLEDLGAHGSEKYLQLMGLNTRRRSEKTALRCPGFVHLCLLGHDFQTEIEKKTEDGSVIREKISTQDLRQMIFEFLQGPCDLESFVSFFSKVRVFDSKKQASKPLVIAGQEEDKVEQNEMIMQDTLAVAIRPYFEELDRFYEQVKMDLAEIHYQIIINNSEIEQKIILNRRRFKKLREMAGKKNRCIIEKWVKNGELTDLLEELQASSDMEIQEKYKELLPDMKKVFLVFYTLLLADRKIGREKYGDGLKIAVQNTTIPTLKLLLEKFELKNQQENETETEGLLDFGDKTINSWARSVDSDLSKVSNIEDFGQYIEKIANDSTNAN